MCDKKNNVLFTDSECVVLSPDFKLLEENHVLLRVPRKNNMYSVDLKNIVPSGGLTCLFAKATLDEYNLWHRRLGHINFKTMNKLVRGNLVRGLPLKIFENNHTCVACQKGKQHKASREEDLLTLEVLTVKNSSYKGRIEDPTLVTELLTRPEVLFSTDVSVISLISSNLMCMDSNINQHAVAIASAQKNKGSLEAKSIVQATSTRVRFHLLTMPFCLGVRGVDV
ncbi:putative ribonuclease H-like domain-containing protein [Tanacetum coccineum]